MHKVESKSNICQCGICCCGILDHLLKKLTCDMKTYQVVNEVKRYIDATETADE